MEGVAATARSLEQTEQLLHKECKRTDADASEFLASLVLSLAVVRANPKFAPTDAEHLSATVERYKTAVTRAITNNDVKRVVTQTRLVAAIEAINFRLLSLVQPHAIAMGVPFAAHQTALAPERDAREWWTAHFSTYPLQVPWELFLSAFSSYLSSLTPQQLLFPSDVTFLRYLLDVNSTGHVGLWKYAELIRLLGHPPQLLGKLRELAAAKWFHGFASSSEAEKMLALAAPGTFLLRFSKAKASAVAIAFKESATAYKHTVIATSAGKYVIDGQKYRSLSHLVLAYAHLLSTPLDHSLLRDASFFGDISGSEAQELMAGRRLGEFLWRFSSRARFLSLTFVAAEAPTQVRHVLIEELLGGGYRVETDSTVHASLAAVVAALTALPIRSAMQHSVWTQPLPPYGAGAASPYEVLVPPAPSPFRSLPDFRAGSYRDLDGDNAGAQPFAPPAAPRVPSPAPDPDAARRTNYASAPTAAAAASSALGTSPRLSDTGRPVVPQLRTNLTPAKPVPSSPPSPGKPPSAALSASVSGSVGGGGTPDKRNKADGYVFMLPVTQPVPLSPHARKPDDSPAGSAISREKSPRLAAAAAAAGPVDEHYEPLLPAASAAIAVPSQHPVLLPSSSSDSSGSGGGSVGGGSGGGGGLQSPPAARWEGAAPRNKESQRTPVRRAPHSGAQSPPVQNSPPRLVIPQRVPSSEVQWVAMPPLPVPQAPPQAPQGPDKGGRQAAATVSTAWRAIKPSTHAPDAAAAKAPLSSSTNATLTRFNSPGSGAGSGPASTGSGGLSPDPHDPR